MQLLSIELAALCS